MQGTGVAWQNAQTAVLDAAPESFWLSPPVGFVAIAPDHQGLLGDVGQAALPSQVSIA